MRVILVFAFFALTKIFHSDSQAAKPSSFDDGIKAERDFPKDGLWIIGDVHGDPDALREILLRTNLVNKEGDWIGAKSGVVLLGDIIGRGHNSRGTLDLVMDLEKKAKKQNGFVDLVLGNHELMVLSGKSKFINDSHNFADFKTDDSEGVVNAFKADTVYAKWLSRKNAILKIGPIVAVHAGLGPWIEKFKPLEINTMLRNWIRFLQHRGPEPEPSTSWVIESNGPLWTSTFSPKYLRAGTPLYEKHMVENWLDHLDAKYMAHGHIITSGAEISLKHPRFGERVISADTGISAADHGYLTALKFENPESAPKDFIFPRPLSCGRFFKQP